MYIIIFYHSNCRFHFNFNNILNQKHKIKMICLIFLKILLLIFKEICYLFRHKANAVFNFITHLKLEKLS